MINLITNPFVIILLLLVPILAYLVYLCAEYKIQIDYLIDEIKFGKSEIRSLRGYIDKKGKERKLYTYESPSDRIENVTHWKEENQQLRLTLVDGSLHVVRIPFSYKLIIQDQTVEESNVKQ